MNCKYIIIGKWHDALTVNAVFFLHAHFSEGMRLMLLQGGLGTADNGLLQHKRPISSIVINPGAEEMPLSVTKDFLKSKKVHVVDL